MLNVDGVAWKPGGARRRYTKPGGGCPRRKYTTTRGCDNPHYFDVLERDSSGVITLEA